MKVTLEKIKSSVPSLNFFMQENMTPSLSFLILELVEEVNSHLKNIEKSTKGKELTEEVIQELLSTEIEVHTAIPKSLLTFDIKPINLAGIKPFLID
jgi:hypothetical protein